MTGINKNRRGKPEQVGPTSTKPDRVSGRGSKHFVHRVFKKCEVMKCIIIIIINIINIFLLLILLYYYYVTLNCLQNSLCKVLQSAEDD